jgi:hypothetical protein
LPYCPYCGKGIAGGASFCPYCTKRLPEGSPQPTASGEGVSVGGVASLDLESPAPNSVTVKPSGPLESHGQRTPESFEVPEYDQGMAFGVDHEPSVPPPNRNSRGLGTDRLSYAEIGTIDIVARYESPPVAASPKRPASACRRCGLELGPKPFKCGACGNLFCEEHAAWNRHRCPSMGRHRSLVDASKGVRPTR